MKHNGLWTFTRAYGLTCLICYFKTLTMNEIISFSFLGFHCLSFRRNIVPASPNYKGNQWFGSINANTWQRKWKGATKPWGIPIPLLHVTREDKQVYVLLHVTVKDIDVQTYLQPGWYDVVFWKKEALYFPIISMIHRKNHNWWFVECCIERHFL